MDMESDMAALKLFNFNCLHFTWIAQLNFFFFLMILYVKIYFYLKGEYLVEVFQGSNFILER